MAPFSVTENTEIAPFSKAAFCPDADSLLT